MGRDAVQRGLTLYCIYTVGMLGFPLKNTSSPLFLPGLWPGPASESFSITGGQLCSALQERRKCYASYPPGNLDTGANRAMF